MAMTGIKQANARVEFLDTEDGVVAKMSGFWTTRLVTEADVTLHRHFAKAMKTKLTFDFSGISGMDTAGAWLVERSIRQSGLDRNAIGIRGAGDDVNVLLKAVADTPSLDTLRAPGADENAFASFFAWIGERTMDFWLDILRAMHILGATIGGAQMKAGRAHGISPAAIVHQLDRMGVGALPVVILMSAIIGAIIAQQGAFQLRYFGAEIFVVDLVGVLVLREIGVLLTAIMVAGRSGSAITAEIGSMKMREEIDALKVIGLNPVGVLVFPRLVALVIALPLLTVISDLVALAGAALVAKTYSGISISAFISRLQIAIDLTTYFAGLIKAPFMALIIGIIASVEGLKVQGSAESLGRHVTSSVVKSIFVVIVVDGLFAMFYAAIDF